MLKVQEIRELIKLVDHSSIDEFEYENDGSKIKMKKNAGATYIQQVSTVPHEAELVSKLQPVLTPAAPSVSAQEVTQEAEKQETFRPAEANLHKIVSPMVGTFYASPTPDADVYVKQGSTVTKDSIVCIVEAMKLFNEIEAEINGEIVEMLVKNGQLVEYGQPLFLVKPE
jgi:acetyl-CoA carboxylase biotin carboxyl carrier protein